MNKSELDSILRKARTPERTEEFWESLPQQIASRLNRARTESWSSSFSLSGRGAAAGITLKCELKRRFPRLAWGFAAAICILAAFAIGHWRGAAETKASTDVLANAKVVRETLAMFPNQVRAIVQDKRGLNLVLSDSDNVPTSTPIYVRVCDGKQCASVVTFSGQDIQIAGQKMTVLSDAQGAVIVAGARFAWSSDRPGDAGGGLKIEAKRLIVATL